jgi:hypothetical protein
LYFWRRAIYLTPPTHYTKFPEDQDDREQEHTINKGEREILPSPRKKKAMLITMFRNFERKIFQALE